MEDRNNLLNLENRRSCQLYPAAQAEPTQETSFIEEITELYHAVKKPVLGAIGVGVFLGALYFGLSKANYGEEVFTAHNRPGIENSVSE